MSNIKGIRKVEPGIHEVDVEYTKPESAAASIKAFDDTEHYPIKKPDGTYLATLVGISRDSVDEGAKKLRAAHEDGAFMNWIMRACPELASEIVVLIVMHAAWLAGRKSVPLKDVAF